MMQTEWRTTAAGRAARSAVTLVASALVLTGCVPSRVLASHAGPSR